MAGLHPYEAKYALLGPSGDVAGHETVSVGNDGAGWLVRCALNSGAPWHLSTEVDWRLEADLGTRVLGIVSRSFGERREIELAVTGNGVLAHRVGPDGPSQVELGWGPLVELDYLSAAFTEFTLRRLAARGVSEEEVTTVSLEPESLEPVIVERIYRRLSSTEWECAVTATGYRARLALDADGHLAEHEGLFRRE